MNTSVCVLPFTFAGQMRYLHAHISFILNRYDGTVPLTHFLRHYFKKHPILGSRDRKVITECIYCYYRCAKGLPSSLSETDRIYYALLLTGSRLDAIRKFLPEDLQDQYGKHYNDIVALLNNKAIGFESGRLFPYDITLSGSLDKTIWLHSMLSKPDLFIRLTEKYRQDALNILHGAGFEQAEGRCIRLPNGTAVEKMLPEKMYRVQDASSQKTADFFTMRNTDTCWDCCSGAGGKSLSIIDKAPDARLCVSDVRASILENLAERFRLYGHKQPERMVLSVADSEAIKEKLQGRRFDHIIADVPCSGSGTWARTPEQLYFFDPSRLEQFSWTQRNIAQNIVPYLRAGGKMVYITCSVFAVENEEIVHYLLHSFPELTCTHSELIKGMDQHADSLFVAVFEKSATED